MNLLRIAARVAARSNVLQDIDQAFESAGVYPPRMKQVGPKKYEGDVDDGWTLEAEDTLPPRFKLNGVPGSLPDLVQSYKKKSVSGPTRSVKRVYCLWPMNDGEEGGEIDRYFDMDVWDMPDGRIKARATLVEGPPVDDTSQLEEEYDSKSGPKTGFFEYMMDKVDYESSLVKDP